MLQYNKVLHYFAKSKADYLSNVVVAVIISHTQWFTHIESCQSTHISYLQPTRELYIHRCMKTMNCHACAVVRIAYCKHSFLIQVNVPSGKLGDMVEKSGK